MIAQLLRRLLSPLPAPLPRPKGQLALAALLVRVARADADYTSDEAARIDKVLARLHGLSPFEAADLRSKAEALEREAPDTVRFTRALKDSVAMEDRAALLEGLWFVALSDGLRDEGEEQVIRLTASLLGLTDRDFGRSPPPCGTRRRPRRGLRSPCADRGADRHRPFRKGRLPKALAKRLCATQIALQGVRNSALLGVQGSRPTGQR